MQNQMLSGESCLTLRVCAYACLVFLLIGAGLGAWGMHSWQVSDLRKELAVLNLQLKQEKEKPPVVQEKVLTRTETQLAYVPKETIKYVDPRTGQEVEQKLDGQFEIGRTEFNYTVNGRPGTLVKADNEKYVFDKNMLKLTQTSTVKLDVEVPTIDRTRRHSIGAWYTNEGWLLSAGHAPGPNFEIKALLAVPEPKKLYGGGVEFRF
ncbi:MAG TPA: hypothetical protein PKA10_10330 [Selenomonadales bacterium]|nr:hypothetical protein [Selenomonadales bacterium]